MLPTAAVAEIARVRGQISLGLFEFIQEAVLEDVYFVDVVFEPLMDRTIAYIPHFYDTPIADFPLNAHVPGLGVRLADLGIDRSVSAAAKGSIAHVNRLAVRIRILRQSGKRVTVEVYAPGKERTQRAGRIRIRPLILDQAKRKI